VFAAWVNLIVRDQVKKGPSAVSAHREPFHAVDAERRCNDPTGGKDVCHGKTVALRIRRQSSYFPKEKGVEIKGWMVR